MGREQLTQPVGCTVDVTTQVLVGAAEQLQGRPLFGHWSQLHDPARMRAGDVGDHEGVLGVGLGFALVEVAGARHRKPVQVADRYAGFPARRDQRAGAACGLVDHDPRGAAGNPGDQIIDRGLLVGQRLCEQLGAGGVQAHRVVLGLADVDADHVGAIHPPLPSRGSW